MSGILNMNQELLDGQPATAFFHAFTPFARGHGGEAAGGGGGVDLGTPLTELASNPAAAGEDRTARRTSSTPLVVAAAAAAAGVDDDGGADESGTAAAVSLILDGTETTRGQSGGPSAGFENTPDLPTSRHGHMDPSWTQTGSYEDMTNLAGSYGHTGSFGRSHSQRQGQGHADGPSMSPALAVVLTQVSACCAVLCCPLPVLSCAVLCCTLLYSALPCPALSYCPVLGCTLLLQWYAVLFPVPVLCCAALSNLILLCAVPVAVPVLYLLLYLLLYLCCTCAVPVLYLRSTCAVPCCYIR